MKTIPYHAETLVDAIQKLRNGGFKQDLKVVDGQLEVIGKPNKRYEPEEFKVIHFQRFEGMSNPADSSIIYALEGPAGTQATFINSYSASATNDNIACRFRDKVQSNTIKK